MCRTGVGASHTCSIDSTQELFLLFCFLPPFNQSDKWWLSSFSSCWQHRYKTDILLKHRWFVKENKDIFFSLNDDSTGRTSAWVTHVRMTGGNRMRMRWSSGISEDTTDSDLSTEKGHSAYCHLYTPSKQTDNVRQNQSIVPYWDHNFFFFFLGHDLAKYHSVTNKD